MSIPTDPPLFSVITVCRNAGSVLGVTMESLHRQTCRDYEYIVVDGASTDWTADVVRAYADLVTSFVSEPDKGIYDAMNKGLRLARGRWVYFLNANDYFADTRVLERVAAVLAGKPDAMLAYGDVYFRTGGANTLFRFDWLSRWNLRFEHLCHQSVFASSILFGRIGAFDTRLRINADYEWLLRAFDSGATTHYLGFPIASYDTTGISAIDSLEKIAERQAVRSKYLPPLLGVPLRWAYGAYRKARNVAGAAISRPSV